MIGLAAIAVLGGVGVFGQPAGPGTGLTVKDFVRVEQGRGDAGGLSTSLARGPANNVTPNDFNGVYQIPEDADSPYAGWYARVAGAVIAVFPRGEYNAGKHGMVPVTPAGTKYFLGSVPLNDKASSRAKREGGAVEPASDRVDNNTRTARSDAPVRLAPDAALPVTLESAKDLAQVQTAVEKLCNDPVYRVNRVRELLERAERTEQHAAMK